MKGLKLNLKTANFWSDWIIEDQIGNKVLHFRLFLDKNQTVFFLVFTNLVSKSFLIF